MTTHTKLDILIAQYEVDKAQLWVTLNRISDCIYDLNTLRREGKTESMLSVMLEAVDLIEQAKMKTY